MRNNLGLSSDNIRVTVRPAASGAASNIRRTLAPTIRVVTGIAAIVLLLACANIAGLFLAQALNRQREFGLRLALGAGQSRLIRQVLSESLLLAVVGGGLGLIFAQWIGPAGFSLATDDTGLRAVDLAPDRSMLAFAGIVSIVAGLVVGIGSVLHASAANPQAALRNVRNTGAPRLTKTLLAAQVALTMALVGSASLLQTLTNFRAIDAGFHPDHLLIARIDAGLKDLGPERATLYLDRATQELAAAAGVEAVTYAGTAMGAGVSMSLSLTIPGFDGAPVPSAGVTASGPAFVRTLGLTLLAGRDFNDTDRGDSAPVAIVNESFALRYFGTADVIGRTFAYRGPGNKPKSIIGVVKDARDRGVKRPAEPMMYVPFAQGSSTVVTITARTAGDPAAMATTVRRTILGLDPAVGIERMRTVEAQFNETLRSERLLAMLGGFFGSLALLLLAIGLYGMLNGMVVRRTTEIGVRMALGAARGRIIWMIARETLGVLVAGVGLGLAIHFAAARFIQSHLFGVAPSDPAVALAAVAVFMAVAAVAVWLPARRATRIEPTEALRHDYT